MSVSNINKMIDYCIKMPKEDEYETGHRYPYYSCELLCSTNGLNIDRLLDIYDEDNNENNEEDLNRMETEKEEKILDTNEKKEEKDNNNEKNNNIIKENISDEGDSKQKNENVKNDKNENPREEIKEESEKKPQENDEKEEEKKENNEEIQENENKDVENKTDKIEEKEEKDNIKEEKSNENIDNNEKEEAKMEIEEIDYKPEKLEEKLPNLSLVHSVLDHIFAFLDDKTSIENTVLSGYFNRIVNYLIKTKTRLTLEYLLLHREKLITKLIANINNISISNIISNILNALTEENTPEANEKYMIIVNSCIEYISKIENNSEEDINSVEFICDLLINHIIYNNKIKFSKIIDANIINNIEKIIIKFYENYEQNSSKILCLINI